MSEAKILFLVNEDQYCELATKFFESFPIQFLKAETLEDALILAGKEQPELILLASDLSRFDAIKGCAAFKQVNELSAIPVVVLEFDNDGDIESFRKAGCNEYLNMPNDRNKLFLYMQQNIPCLELHKDRVPYYSQVTIRDDENLFYGMTGDISSGGLFVATFDRLPAEGELKLSFNLPDDNSTSVETKGRVVWLNSKNRPVSSLPEGFGVEFMSLSREEYLSIKEYIAAERKKKYEHWGYSSKATSILYLIT